MNQPHIERQIPFIKTFQKIKKFLKVLEFLKIIKKKSKSPLQELKPWTTKLRALHSTNWVKNPNSNEFKKKEYKTKKRKKQALMAKPHKAATKSSNNKVTSTKQRETVNQGKRSQSPRIIWGKEKSHQLMTEKTEAKKICPIKKLNNQVYTKSLSETSCDL